MRPTPTASLAAVALFMSWGMWGCDVGASSADRLSAVASVAKSPTGGRAAAAATLTTLFADGKVSYEDAINAAFAALEAATPTPPGGQASVDATLLAGAVLDAIAARENQMATGGELELFWSRVGGLAFKAAEEAHAKGRSPEAMSLVFAGGARWNNDSYWNRRPDHDALAAILLALSGDRARAIDRLKSRPELLPPADEALRILQKSN